MTPPLQPHQTQLLRELYRKFPAGRDRLYSAARLTDQTISRRQVAEFLAGNEEHQLHVLPHKLPTLRPIVTKHPFSIVQADLVDYSSLAASNFQKHFLLNVVDTFSKYGESEPIADKSSAAVAAAMERILERLPLKPKTLSTDNGTEFNGPEFRNLCRQLDIKQIFSKPHTPQSHGQIERFNRTIKNYIARYMTVHHTQRWLNSLPDIIKYYNDTKHETTRISPNAILNDTDDVREMVHERIAERADRPHGKAPAVLPVGTMVRLRLPPQPNEKGYVIKWTNTTYPIEKVYANKYDYQSYLVNGKQWRRDALLPVTAPQRSVAEVVARSVAEARQSRVRPAPAPVPMEPRARRGAAVAARQTIGRVANEIRTPNSEYFGEPDY